MSQSFYEEHLLHIPLEPLDNMLDIECAGGDQLPYLGFVQVRVTSSGCGVKGKGRCCLLLVVPNTKYNERVPVLLGTNVLSCFLNECRITNGARFLQKADLYTPWFLAFRSIVLQEKELAKNDGSLALVRNAELNNITIPGNSTAVIKGQIARGIDYPQVCALLQPTTHSSLSETLDIAPTLIHYDRAMTDNIEVHVFNVTTRTIVVPTKALLCELHPVTLEGLPLGQPIDSEGVLDQVEIDTHGLTEEEVKESYECILRFKDLFAKNDQDLGLSSHVRHQINLENDIPFKQRHRHIPPSMYLEVRSHLRDLVSAGVIRPSHSPWASNVVLARKKDGKLRMCIDYRQLNNRTIKDSYALPRIEDLLDCLGGNKYYSVLDMKSGYYQVEIEETHKERTAFTVGPLGFFEYNRMPFGLSNAPATYQRLMEDCLGDLHLNICLVYIDDLIVFSKSFEEHIRRLELVLHRLGECGLKLAPQKCEFFKRKVKYVGHVVSEQGIEADPEKVDKIKHWPTPTNPEQVRQFLGFAGYYRKFVKDFSKIAKPLSELMPRSAMKKSRRPRQVYQAEWKWGNEQDEAFKKLIACLSTPPVLGYPDYSKPFELHTDASMQGLGAVLYQEQEGILRVIAYASRGLSRSEKNYSAHKLEFLCLKWAISEKFHDYLYGQDFVVMTDNNPLTYILTSARLDATGHRWLASLASYNFTVKYRPGKTNTDADILSRLPGREESVLEELSKDSVQAICNMVHVSNHVESICMSADVVDVDDVDIADDVCSTNAKNWEILQYRDPELNIIINHLKNNMKPDRAQYIDNPHLKALVKNFCRFQICHGVLYRITTLDGTENAQLVLPTASRAAALRSLHDDIGHPGRDRTLSLLKERFYWPGMNKDVKNYIQSCDRCVKRKTPTNQRAPLVSIKTSQPLELVSMDFLALEPSKGGQQYVLIITDHFTRFAQAYPSKNMSAKTTAELFFHNFVVHYGLPMRIHSDKGANFVGKVMTELCQLLKIDKSSTTPYHPMGNGMCERFNRTLCDMLGTLDPTAKRDWKTHIGPLVHAYNCTQHESTGYSPYYLMFGRHPRLPVDLAFGLDIEPSKPKSLLQYTKSLRDRLKQAYELASGQVKKSQTHQKSYYDEKARAAVLTVGDRVLVKVVAFEGRHKLADKWEDDVYVILNQPNPSIPVFTVGKENGEGRKRTLHRNLLLPIGAILRKELPIPKPRQRLHVPTPAVRTRRQDLTSESDSDGDDSDSDEELMPIPISSIESPDLADTTAEGPPGDEVDFNGGVSAGSEEEDSVDAVQEEQVEVVNTAEILGSSPEQITGVDEESTEEALTTSQSLRRSQRTRRKPDWMNRNDYVMSVTTQPDWIVKANFLTSLIADGILSSDCQVRDTLLSLISGK